MAKVIMVAGLEITPELHPNLYRIAERNPDGLAEQFRAWAKTAGNSDLSSAATTLEHDLAHERASLGK